jgi:hypothetical protein
MSQPKICNFYNKPQGCRYGTKCHFLHEARDTFGPLSSFAPSASQNARPDNVPNGVCRFYWNGDTCRRVNCWFKHVRSDESLSACGSSTSADSRKARPPTIFIAPGSFGGHSPLRPGEAKRQLSTIFLQPGFRFGLPSTINRFVMILASCSVSNEWVFHTYSHYG